MDYKDTCPANATKDLSKLTFAILDAYLLEAILAEIQPKSEQKEDETD